MKLKLTTLGVTAGLLIAAASAGYGQTITVPNGTFTVGSPSSSNYQFGSGSTTYPTDWTTVSGGLIFSLYTPSSLSLANQTGNLVESFTLPGAGYNGAGTVYQQLTNDYVSGDSYTLTVFAGAANGNALNVGDQLVLENTNRTVLQAYTIPSGTGNGSLTQYSLTYSASSAVNGTPIILGFTVPSQSAETWMEWNNFQLTQNPPATSYLWSNAPADSNWANSANWAGASVPTASSALVFSTSTITALNNNITGATNASLTFSNNAPAYTIGGNTLTLSGVSQGIYNNSSSTQTINLPIANPSGISLVTTNSGGNLVINGVVSGAGGVTASGTGTTTLSATNTYTGTTAVSSGSLLLSGSLSNSAVTVSTGSFSETSVGSIAGTTGFTQSGAGTSTLAGTNTYTGATTVSSGSLTVNGSLNGSALTVSGGSATVSGALTNSGVSVSSGSLALSGPLSGSGGVSVSGGSAVLSGNNTNNTGNFSLSGGTLTLQANSGNTVGGISYALSKENLGSSTFDNGATLKLLSDSNVTFAGGNNLGPVGGYTSQNYFVDQLTSGNSNNTITFAPGGIIVAYTTINVTGNNDGYTLVLGNLTGVAGDGPATSLSANGANLQIGAFSANTLAVGGSNNTTITGGITSGVDTISKSGSGTLILSGAVNTNSGALTISGGTVQLTSAATLGSSAITDNGQFIYGSSASQALNVISGSGSLIANGSGTLTLSATNTYTGKTTISSETVGLGTHGSLASTNIVLAGGTLDASGQTAYTLTTNQTLSGSGTVLAGSTNNTGLTLNGKLSPGVGTTNGLIAVTGNWTLGSVSTTTFKIGTPTTAGTTYDAATITGALTYNGTLDIVINTPSYGTYDIFSAAGYANNFTNVALSGFASGLFTETGGNWYYNSTNDNISFVPGTGVLTEAVPEPSTFVLLGVAMFCGLVVRHRISRNKERNS